MKDKKFLNDCWVTLILTNSAILQRDMVDEEEWISLSQDIWNLVERIYAERSPGYKPDFSTLSDLEIHKMVEEAKEIKRTH